MINTHLLEKEIVILGTGERGRRAFYYLLNEKIKINYFADRNKEIIGKHIIGHEVIYEDELIGKNYNVIIASEYWEDIKERLEKKGIDNLFVWNYEKANTENVYI
mgnify:FL=1